MPQDIEKKLDREGKEISPNVGVHAGAYADAKAAEKKQAPPPPSTPAPTQQPQAAKTHVPMVLRGYVAGEVEGERTQLWGFDAEMTGTGRNRRWIAQIPVEFVDGMLASGRGELLK